MLSGSSSHSPRRLLTREPFLGVLLLNTVPVLSLGEFFLIDLTMLCAAKVNTLGDSCEDSLESSLDLAELAASSRMSGVCGLSFGESSVYSEEADEDGSGGWGGWGGWVAGCISILCRCMCE